MEGLSERFRELSERADQLRADVEAATEAFGPKPKSADATTLRNAYAELCGVRSKLASVSRRLNGGPPADEPVVVTTSPKRGGPYAYTLPATFAENVGVDRTGTRQEATLDDAKDALRRELGRERLPRGTVWNPI